MRIHTIIIIGINMWNRITSNSQVLIVAMIVGIGFMGIALPYPIFAPMLLGQSDPILLPTTVSHSTRMVMLGMLLAVYQVGEFLGAPMLGALSDIQGRKKTLIITLTGTTIGYGISALAILTHSFWLLVISRLFTGFCEGNIAIAQASVADMSDSVDKVKGFSWINTAAALGYTLGPLLGGLLASGVLWRYFGYSLPFFMAMLFALIALLCVIYFFQETVISTDNPPIPILSNIITHFISGIKSIPQAFQQTPVRRALLIFLFLFIGIDLFYEFYPLYFVAKWQFSALDIAWFTAVYCVPYMFSQIIIVLWVSKKFNPTQILIGAGIMCAIILIIMVIPNSYKSLYITLALLGIAYSFCSTNVGVLLSNAVSSNEQGKILGVAQSLRMLNSGLFALIGGFVAVMMASLPLILASLAILVSVGMVLRKTWRK